MQSLLTPTSTFRRWAHGSKIAYTLRTEALLSVCHVIRGHVLDLGCGGKPYRELLGRSAQRWTGLDHSMTASGRSAANVHGDALALPFASESFDMVLCTEVLEHVTAPHVLFQEVRRVLKPDGHLVLTVPQVNPLHEEPHDYFRVTRYALSMLAEQNQLEVVAMKRTGGAIATVGQLVMWHMWHMNWIGRIPLVGAALRSIVVGSLGSLVLSLDRLSRRNGGSAALLKDTLGWTFVARKVHASQRQ